jgi:ATP-dependent RNA helicase RhlE
VVVATPGRLLDLTSQGAIDLSRVEVLVLDEADRMLDMGFIRDIRRLAQNLLHQPVEIEVARRNAAVDSVEQRAYLVPKDQKRALLSHLIQDGDWSQVLVFTRTKHGANRLTKQLQEDGIEAAAIHGNKSQSARTQALAGFKSYDVRALVATEVASRGLDIKELPHVVNYELPNVPEDYVHRIGRTGRAGATGIAVSLVALDETGLMRDIEKVLRKQIPQLPLPHFTRAQPQPQRAAAPAQHADSRHSQPRHAQSKHAQPKHGQPKQSQGKPPNRRRRWQSRSRPQASAR